MSNLKHVRGGPKGRLTILTNQVKAQDRTTVVRANIFTYSKTLEHLKISFDTNYTQLEAQCADEAEVAQLVTHSDPIFTELISLETLIGELEDMAALKAEEVRILAEARARAAHPPPTPPTQPVSIQQPKLPTLSLPTFTGKYEEWISFRDRFDQAVDKRINLSGAEKLQYLLISLGGSAKETVKNIPVEDANYKLAYDHRSANSLRDLVTITENSLSAIKSLGHNTDDWDPIVVAVVVRKLESATHLRFHQSLPNKETPALQTLIDILNKEAIDLASVVERTQPLPNHSRESQQQPSQAPRWKILFNPTCDICQQPHYNYRCPKLTGTPERDRKKVTEKAKLCTNCLKPGHFWKQCQGPKDHVTPFKPTAIVEIRASNGTLIKSRALLDNCLDETFIAESLVRRLGLKRETLKLPRAIEALQHTPVTNIKEVVEFDVISTYHQNVSMNVRAYVIKDIGGPYPKTEVNPASFSHIPSEGLADPTFNKPGKVEILFYTYFHYMVIRPGIFRGKEGIPIAQESTLGWLVEIGRATPADTTIYNALTCTLDTQPESFWKVEELSLSAMHTPEESRQFKIHIKRFHNTELRLQRNPDLRKQVSQAIADLITDGHLQRVSLHKINIPDNQCYYLPHHAAFKQSSSSTKSRIVFDASAKTSTTISLKDRLMTGPVLQEDLHSLLVRWRYWLVPLVADIRQMYLQIKVHPKHHDFLRLVGRESPSQHISIYSLSKVTFGTASAPYQAVRTLHQLAHDHPKDYPSAAEVLRRDFYVDDCLTGTNSSTEAIHLNQKLTSITNKVSFSLRKSATSCSTTLTAIPDDMRESSSLTLDKAETTKSLGLIWNPAADDFRFKISLNPSAPTTKRRILSAISKVFDPLGFLTPVTIRAKILMQKLWQCKIGWDVAPPKDILTAWNLYLEELSGLESIRIPRSVNQPQVTIYELHGFADASERAYGAVVYLRCHTESSFQVRLLTSKTRVAPLKSLTVPKLELSAAVLLAQLIAIPSHYHRPHPSMV
ncbi:unnamed protein product [Allacma fusca]|uniref:Uncharacterized protein n=1 Tax=Allacma fusca TaxID=39272 RepID=A0A8J2PBC4_9HEXA|nr:unnamed protein product [Allacma fusca]